MFYYVFYPIYMIAMNKYYLLTVTVGKSLILDVIYGPISSCQTTVLSISSTQSQTLQYIMGTQQLILQKYNSKL